MFSGQTINIPATVAGLIASPRGLTPPKGTGLPILWQPQRGLITFLVFRLLIIWSNRYDAPTRMGTPE
jgi:hypothetical protein